MDDSAALSEPSWFQACWRWAGLHPRVMLVFSVVAALTPFLGKPFNMDDPLFVWAARHIQAHPADPYGFDVNWYGTPQPMWMVTKNPPLACYYLALAAGVLGWGEPGLHGAMLLPALGVILGTYRLARHLCPKPFLATLITLLSPAFLVSSTTLMCDVLMLAFWVWAIIFWVEGLERGSLGRLMFGGCLVALAGLTKYYGVVLVPLLAVYSLVRERQPGRWCLGLALPVAVLTAYSLAMRALYGHTLLGDAADYAKAPEALYDLINAKLGGLLTGLTFTGGCLASAAVFIPLFWRPRHLAALGIGTTVFAGTLLLGGAVLKDFGPLRGTSRALLEVQMVFWAIGGVGILALALAELQTKRDAGSWLLILWVLGVFLFAGLINWTVNARSILPIAPAVGILVARRLARAETGDRAPSRLGHGICLGLAAILGLLVTRADLRLAQASRASARQTYAKYGSREAPLWFQGHWGFQYYLESLGARAVDVGRTPLRRGDLIATPVNTSNFAPLGPELVVLRELIVVPGPRFLTTMRGEVGAGFYASLRGPLPFAFGLVPPEEVAICAVEPLPAAGGEGR